MAAARSRSPRVTARYEVTRATALTAAAGLYRQQPTYDELSSVFGNPKLKAISATHYSLSLTHQFTPALSLDATLSYKYMTDIVVRSSRAVEDAGRLVSERFANDGKGEAYGFELLGRHQLYRGFFGWLGYTFMRGTRQDAPGESYHLFRYDQTHIVTAIASYKFGRGWQVGLRWRFTSGNPFTPNQGGFYDSNADRYRPIPGALFSERLPAFHQLDFRLDKEWTFERWRFSLYVDVQNTYFRENPEAIRYNFDYTERFYITGIPILPTLGIRGEW